MSIENAYCRTYTKATKSIEVAGIVLSESSYRPFVSIPFHRHEDHGYFNLVVRGGYSEKTKKASVDLSPSTLIFHPPGASHTDQFHMRETRLFNVRFGSGWLRAIRDHAPVLDRTATFKGGPVVRLAVKLYREFCGRDSISPLMIEGLLLETLAEATRCSDGARPRMPSWLARGREIIHYQFRQSVTLSELAGAAGVHRVHFGREFRRHFGCTVGEYIQGLRVEFACRRISSSDASLSEIALEAGFADQSHFSRTFKHLVGVTPAHYKSLTRPH
jgi:AraC family transcriptional regulator